MQEDKIFNNNYGDNDSRDGKISFVIASAYEDNQDYDDKIHYDTLFEKINDLIIDSEFNSFNKITEKGLIKKINKVQINRIYCFIIENIGLNYSRVDIFSVLSDYFDVAPNKFYNSLSNKFKDELILELDAKYNILEKKKIRKLF